MRLAVGLAVFAAALALTAPAGAGTIVRTWFPQGEQLRYGVRAVDRRAPLVPSTLRSLLAGPTAAEARGGARTAFARGTRLLGLRRAGSLLTVQLDRRFLQQTADSAASVSPARLRLRVLQLGRTLQQFPAVQRFRISVAGQLVQTYPELGLRWRPSPDGGWRLAELAAATSAPLDTRPTLRDLQNPEQLRLAQAVLAQTGWLDSDAVTGTLDYSTAQAITAFEAWSGLPRDGQLSPESFARILHAARPLARSHEPGRHVEIYRSLGVVLLVRDGVVVRAVHASTGAPGRETPAGSFHVYRKERLSWSIPFMVWMPWASYFTGGIAMHGYPDVPAYPASHGCVRLPAPEAPGVYAFAAQGATVDVF